MTQTRSQAGAAASGDLLARARASSTNTVLKGSDHWLIIGPNATIRRQLRPSEYLINCGKIIAPYWFAERLRNELAVTDFLRANTTIPIPKSRLYEENGLLHLETEHVAGGIPLLDLTSLGGEKVRTAAVRAVDAQIRDTILPQLQALKSNRIGSVDADIPVFPPFRVFQNDRRSWPRITSQTEDFVLCHTGLDEQDIIVDPETYKIVAIARWEFAGFFPPYFELPVWMDSISDGTSIYDDAKLRELAFFGLTPQDLNDESSQSHNTAVKSKIRK